jgi:hypothetical protein
MSCCDKFNFYDGEKWVNICESCPSFLVYYCPDETCIKYHVENTGSSVARYTYMDCTDKEETDELQPSENKEICASSIVSSDNDISITDIGLCGCYWLDLTNPTCKDGPCIFRVYNGEDWECVDCCQCEGELRVVTENDSVVRGVEFVVDCGCYYYNTYTWQRRQQGGDWGEIPNAENNPFISKERICGGITGGSSLQVRVILGDSQDRCPGTDEFGQPNPPPIFTLSVTFIC